ncbi:MAG: class I SAM-dependent methyltransferase [Alcanivoracaceae bacterium]|nr:class I SAM-dependent methyltransferase [Alcanivoracaceae bacterium]
MKKHDIHQMYQDSVQCVEAEIDFVKSTYLAIRGNNARFLREDFCGTGQTAGEWVSRDEKNRAWAIDLDEEVLQWGQDNILSELVSGAHLTYVKADVRESGVANMDVVLAMNFSYFLFMDRTMMRDYFISVKSSLEATGVFFLDAFGGYEAAKELTEERECEGFTYIWEQATFNPINSQMQCYIHFKTDDGVEYNRAFSYYWRLWSLPEIQELLLEAGFSQVDVYWEGTDEKSGEGDGKFKAAKVGTADAGWICYIVALP